LSLFAEEVDHKQSAWKGDDNISHFFTFIHFFTTFHFFSFSFTFCHSLLKKVIISNPPGKVMTTYQTFLLSSTFLLFFSFFSLFVAPSHFDNNQPGAMLGSRALSCLFRYFYHSPAWKNDDNILTLFHFCQLSVTSFYFFSFFSLFFTLS
jgi:hypothetical protein